MDFDHSSLQSDLMNSLAALLRRHAGVQRCRALFAAGSYDSKLESALADGDYTDIFAAVDDGPLLATMAVESIAAELGAVTAAARLLVLPALGIDLPPGPIVLRREGDDGPVRYGSEAKHELVIGSQRVTVRELDPGRATARPSVYGYPLASVVGTDIETFDQDAATVALNWWRVGIAAEAVGMMRKSFEVSRSYATVRTTFGHPIGSLQALQHRLAELSVKVEAARWMTYETAYHGAPEESASAAAGYTMSTVTALTRETHQIMGAIGLTTEHDLHLWTLRLQAIRGEAGGPRSHLRSLSRTRWPVGV